MSWLFKDLVVIMNEIMYWLFKDQINSGLAQFDHAQSNSKKRPKCQKDQIALNDFFSWKTTNKIFTYLLVPFILQNFKKFLDLIQSYEDVPFSDPKWTICADFFSTNHYYYLHIAIGTFHCAKCKKKILTANPELRGCVIFGPKMVHLPSIFFLKEIIINFIYLLAPFILQNFKKILWEIPELLGCAIFRFVLNKMFWCKPLLLFSSTYWPFSLGKI